MTRAREPIFNVPVVVLSLGIVLAAIQVALNFIPEDTSNRLIIDFAFIPVREMGWLSPNALAALVQAGPIGTDPDVLDRYQLARYLLAHGGSHLWAFVTYAGLHAGYLHLTLNLVMLFAMGTPVARRIGAARFLILFAVGAVAGALLDFAVHPTGVVPLVGASASISAYMGAAARFVFDPQARIGGPALPLGLSLRNRAVITFTVGWFLANALSGLGANPSVLADASIAWEAHIGGFLVGFLGFAVFDRHMRDALPIPGA